LGNKKVALLRYSLTPNGWRRLPVLMGKNGRVKPGWVLLKGEPVHCPQGHYELRFYEGSKPVYKNVGNDGPAALAAHQRQIHLMAARDSASGAGAVIVEEPGRVRLAPALSKFVKQSQARGSMEAAEKYRLAGGEFLIETGRIFGDEVVPDDIYDYWLALRKRKVSERTIADRTRFLLPILRSAGVDTSKFPKPPKVEKKLPTVYGPDELQTLFAHDLRPEHRLLFSLLLKTGLRDQEAQHLEWVDLNWRDKTLLVRSKPRWGFKVKDAEERSIPIPDELLVHLQDWRKSYPNTSLVLGTRTDKPNDKWLRVLKRYVRDAGLNCRVCDGCTERGECRKWTLHGFRRTYATTLLQNGIDLRTVQRYMGHSDMESTMRYLTPATGKAARDSLERVQWGV
jgi:integrase